MHRNNDKPGARIRWHAHCIYLDNGAHCATGDKSMKREYDANQAMRAPAQPDTPVTKQNFRERAKHFAADVRRCFRDVGVNPYNDTRGMWT